MPAEFILEETIESFAERMLQVSSRKQKVLRQELQVILDQTPQEALVRYILDGLPKTQRLSRLEEDFGNTDSD